MTPSSAYQNLPPRTFSSPQLPQRNSTSASSVDLLIHSPDQSLSSSFSSERTYLSPSKEGSSTNSRSVSPRSFRKGSDAQNSINVPSQPTASEVFAIPIYQSDVFNGPEDDDWLHQPNEKRDWKHDKGGTVFTPRGAANLGCLLILTASVLMLFAGYPILNYYQHTTRYLSNTAVEWEWDLAKINGSLSQHDLIHGRHFSAIDPDTPADKRTIVSDKGGVWDLVFSDEFETPDRSFYPGDDPYWEAIDLHAWSTGDLEYYSPTHVTTGNGALRITMEERESHNLNYTSAEIQSWNKLCFVGGRLEVSSRLPGRPDVFGLWPAVWTMGNLGRAGYGSTLEGLWPYSYNECDVGAAPNQTLNGLPTAALTSGWPDAPYNGALSYLPGQRLSRCVCPDDEDHPGPKNPDGSWVGRSAPEIDLIEAQVDNAALTGEVSQSAQFAPFNAAWGWNTNDGMEVFDSTVTRLNSYAGGPFQQSSSGVSTTNQTAYQYTNAGTLGGFAMFAFEYKTGSDGYVTWWNNGLKAWTYSTQGMAANATVDVGQRPIPYEPMYIIINLALSLNFGAIDYEGLKPYWPFVMEIDYVRVYQDTSPGSLHTLGCNPESAPTASYIERFYEGYHNNNLTTWEQLSGTKDLPLNSLTGTCS